MAFSTLFSNPARGARGRQSRTRAACARGTSGRRLRLELLEPRALLSVSGPGFAEPLYKAVSATSRVGSFVAPAGYGFSPAQVRHAYGFDQVGLDGTGTTIAIVDAYNDPTIASDLHQFDQAFGLFDPVLSQVNQSGGSSLPANDTTGWASEIALDVEWAHAIAPGAKILLVEAADNSYGNLFSAVDWARKQPGVVAVSMSWGGGEFSSLSSQSVYDNILTTPAGHTGVTFFVASGDTGAPASYPAASPNVVAVGGTSLYLGSGNNYYTESGWNGSGGGKSGIEPLPSYQQGTVPAGVTTRANPDVAYNADPYTGFPVYDSYSFSGAAWQEFGGTSDAAPQWAALIALADQGRIAAGLKPLDGATQTLPMLYSLRGTDFHDVVGGTSTGTPNYTAVTGYDFVTGIGSPIANRLINDLVGSSVSATTATHFSVTASPSTAGVPVSSITVSALNALGNVVPGYTGTVHFTTSDANALLPLDYTFSAADNGTHTFTNAATFYAAGNRTTTATDTSTSIAGSGSVPVSPAVAATMVFGQQPTNLSIGAAISPAVTVRLFDAYGNLATGSTGTVSIALLNTSVALGGTTIASVANGSARFGNLTVPTAGTYQLTASFGNPAIAATSNSFAVAVAPATTTIDNFDSGNLNLYKVVNGTTASASIATSAGHLSPAGLLDANGNDWIYRTDTAAQMKPGGSLSAWLESSGAANGRAYFGFGATSAGTFSLVTAPNTNQLILQSNSGYNSYTNLAAATQTFAANHWYRLQVDWGSTGTVVGRLFDSNGTTLLKSVTATVSSTGGGVAFRAIGNNKFWDTVQLTPGVNAVKKATTVSPRAASAAVSGTAGAVGQPRSVGVAPAGSAVNRLGPALTAAFESLLPAAGATSPSRHPLDGRLVDLLMKLGET